MGHIAVDALFDRGRGMPQRVSSKDVAALAGVSRAAVSRTFGNGQVSERVRARVTKAAETLGYRPNALARSLTGSATDLIAVILADSLSTHNRHLIEQLVVAIARNGKRSLVVPAAGDDGIDESALNAADYQVDALVVLGGTVSPATVDRLRRVEVPLFLYEREVDDPRLECVVGDNAAGGRLAARYLLRCGHRRIAYLTKPLMTYSNQARHDGFARALAEDGQTIYAEAHGEQGHSGGYNAAMKLFSMAEPPDAVFCFNDEMAFGALQAAATMKLSVPGDVAIIGYDNIPMSAWPVFDLTTIHNSIDEPIRILMDRIVERLAGQPNAPDPHRFAPELVVRGTTL